MCGRVTLTYPDFDELADELEESLAAPLARPTTLDYRPRYNLAPTNESIIVLADQIGAARAKIVAARWGFRTPSQPAVINARAETLAERPLFRGALESRIAAERGRCLVPADGFYEWQGSQPIWFHRQNKKLLLLAGLYEVDPDGALLFTIITTSANRTLAPVHDRMPVVLAPLHARDWLAAPRLDLLVPAPDDTLVAQAVSERVSSTANDDPDCLAPARQLQLF